MALGVRASRLQGLGFRSQGFYKTVIGFLGFAVLGGVWVFRSRLASLAVKRKRFSSGFWSIILECFP